MENIVFVNRYPSGLRDVRRSIRRGHIRLYQISLRNIWQESSHLQRGFHTWPISKLQTVARRLLVPTRRCSVGRYRLCSSVCSFVTSDASRCNMEKLWNCTKLVQPRELCCQRSRSRSSTLRSGRFRPFLPAYSWVLRMFEEMICPKH
jgi:hypothetical protein